MTLSAMESSALTHAEASIERGLSTFVEVGNALAQIRDDRLYRADFGTFEDYCSERWNLDRTRAYDIIGAAKTVAAVSEISDIAPTNEGQAKALRGLAPEAAAETLRRAHDTTAGKVTAAAIRDARPDSKPDPAFVAKAAVDEFPELTHYVESDRRDEAIRIAASLRTYDEPSERERRREILRKTILAEKRQDNPPREITEDEQHAVRAEQIFFAANLAAQQIEQKGGAETVRHAIAYADPLELENWRDQFLSLARLCEALAEACQPTLRRIK